jgi:hypothetical protein
VQRAEAPSRWLKILAGSDPVEQPACDEIEVSLFGPGYGESIAMHLGDGEWMIVDSCEDSETGTAAALDYLDRIGIDSPQAVKVVVATHWHDDHIRGLAEIVDRCAGASFGCSNAFQSRELLTLVSAPASGTDHLSAGTTEFSKVLSIIRSRRAKGSLAGGNVDLLSDKSLVFRSSRCEVRALSPSPISIEHALQAFADLLPQRLRPHLRIIAPKPNAASVALWLEGKTQSALLGADLEVEAQENRGWGAVLSLEPARARRAGLVKIPHHGSAGAHDPRMWDELLEKQPAAILTPWHRGASALPTDSDRARICGLAPAAVIAGRDERKTSRYDGAVERTLKEVAITRRSAIGRAGHIRARSGPADAGAWRVELVRDAALLCEAA